MFLSRFPRHDALATAIPFTVHQDTGHQSETFLDHDGQLIADCHGMVATKENLLVRYAKSASDDVVDQACSSAYIQQLSDKVEGYGRRIANTCATTGIGLQNKRALVGVLLAELTDDPSPICDQLLLSLLNDFDRFCVNSHSSNCNTSRDHPDDQMMQACGVNLEQIEEVCAECIRVGALPPLQELGQPAMFLMASLMSTRRSIIEISGMPASSINGCCMKGHLLRRMIAVGGADVHPERLTLARSFVADIAAVGPHSEAEIEVVGSAAHWWTSFTSKFWPLKGTTTSP